MQYVKFLTNRKESILFKFDSGLEKEGNYGKQYAYGVKWNGEDSYLYDTEALNRLLQSINPLKNRTIQIEKAQDPKDLKRTYWVIYDENGVEITPRSEGQPQVPVPTENAPYAKPEANNDEIAALNARLDKASDAFKALRDEMLDRMKSLEALVSTVTSENAVSLHTSIKNRDIQETKTPSLEEAAKIVDSHKEIPIINELPKGFETLQRSM